MMIVLSITYAAVNEDGGRNIAIKPKQAVLLLFFMKGETEICK